MCGWKVRQHLFFLVKSKLKINYLLKIGKMKIAKAKEAKKVEEDIIEA